MPPNPDFIQRSNAVYIEEMYERFQQDPASVPADWAAFFAGFELAGGRRSSGETPPAGAGPGSTPGIVRARVARNRVNRACPP